MERQGGKVGFDDGDIVVEAETIARGLGLDPSQVPDLMRNGKITCLHERGLDDDAGQHRITFFHADRSFQLIADASGNVTTRSNGEGAAPE